MRILRLKGGLYYVERITYQKVPYHQRIELNNRVIGGLRVSWPVQEVSE